MINFIKDIYMCACVRACVRARARARARVCVCVCVHTHKIKIMLHSNRRATLSIQGLYNRALFFYKETLERCSLLKLLFKLLLKLCQTFSFFRLSVSWKSTPTYSRMQGPGRISHRRRGNRFLRWNSANMPDGFSMRGVSTGNREHGWCYRAKRGERAGILRTMSERNKGTKKVLRSPGIRCRGRREQPRHRGQLLAAMNTAVSHRCVIAP